MFKGSCTLSAAVGIRGILIGVALELRLGGVEDLGLGLDVSQGSHPGRVAVQVVLVDRLLALLLLLLIHVTEGAGPGSGSWIAAAWGGELGILIFIFYNYISKGHSRRVV